MAITRAELAGQVYRQITTEPDMFICQALAYVGAVEDLPTLEMRAIRTIEQVLLCMGPEKATFFSALLREVFGSVLIEQTSPQNPEDHLLPPELIALGKFNGSEVNDKQMAIAQDVLLYHNGLPINKPNAQSLSEAKELLVRYLGVSQKTTFVLLDGLAIQLTVSSVAIRSSTRFTILPFSDEEIDAYLSSITLDEFNKTNGGFRWPHPIFINHIVEVDGTGIEDANYIKKIYELFLRLLGVNPQYLSHLLLICETLYSGTNETEKLYRLIELRDGTLGKMQVQRECGLVSDTDIAQISCLVCHNFKFHPNYQSLSDDARAAYINANNIEGTTQVCTHEKNIAVLSMKNGFETIGYLVLRDRGDNVAEIRRLHSSRLSEGLGVGTTLLAEAERIADDMGYDGIAVVASGSSDEAFFSKHGYRGNGKSQNGKMAERGIDVAVHYMLKPLGLLREKESIS